MFSVFGCSLSSRLFCRGNKYPRVVVFVTNHANDDTGDLYVNPNFSAQVDEVSGILSLLSVYLIQAVRAVHESSPPKPSDGVPSRIGSHHVDDVLRGACPESEQLSTTFVLYGTVSGFFLLPFLTDKHQPVRQASYWVYCHRTSSLSYHKLHSWICSGGSCREVQHGSELPEATPLLVHRLPSHRRGPHPSGRNSHTRVPLCLGPSKNPSLGIRSTGAMSTMWVYPILDLGGRSERGLSLCLQDSGL